MHMCSSLQVCHPLHEQGRAERHQGLQDRPAEVGGIQDASIAVAVRRKAHLLQKSNHFIS